MRSQTNFSGHSSGQAWGTFLEGLRHGHTSSYIVLIGLAVFATVALWAGTNLMKKEGRR